MIFSEESYLAHYGILRKSGRYPYGSGGPEYASNKSFLGYVAQLKSQGLSEKDVAEGMGITTTELRAAKSIAKNEEKAANMGMAQRLRDKGMSNVAIGERMGINESSVRSLLAPGAKDRNDVLTATADMLKREIEQKSYIDIGSGVETHLGVSKTKLGNAVAILREQGYKVHYVKVQQLGTGKETTIKVMSKPDVPYSEVFKNRADIQTPGVYSEDGGHTYPPMLPPLSISSSRVAVRYAEDGGSEADGVMFVREGVPDITLGGSRYAQVRVAVDGSHYLKGMAVYKNDLPPGVDIVFNTNKDRATLGSNKLAALKPMKADKDGNIDPTNPFGSAIKRQIKESLPDGSEKVTSVMNLVNEEGQWGEWRKALSSQVLSKQAPVLARQQLDMTYERAKQELDEIKSLTNPTVKRKLLESYADSTDSSAVHLKAAALPRQGSHVILPVPTLKESEVYAPNYRNGERVALIRYPHGGKFEIPELTVNNNHPDAKTLMGRAPDAIGIHPEVAKKLSGADFDGDTVLVIPNTGSRKLATQSPLQGLKDFDPQRAYAAYEGMPKMSPRTKQIEMGVVSNLITDMTIRNASSAELAAAVRHSMVVIDAEKHNLDYKRSAQENGISNLKRKYQSDPNNPASRGASTLISRATSEIRVPDRTIARVKDGGPIDKATGRVVFKETGKTYVNAKGQTVPKTIKSVKLAETHDAKSLSSGTPIEKVYADHSNKLKALANEARRVSVHTKNIPYSPSAKKAYAKEVHDLNVGLTLALRNAPLERRAQLLANANVSAKKKAYPDMEPSELKKVKAQALLEARNRTGAGKTRIELTDAHWSAIQAGAISPSKLEAILTNADLDKVKALATPRTKLLMTSAKSARAHSMAAAGYTQAEIADALGVSLTTLKEGIK